MSSVQNWVYRILFLHPPSSTDIAPSDLHLFCSSSNAKRGVSFNNFVVLKAKLCEFFESGTGDFNHGAKIKCY